MWRNSLASIILFTGLGAAGAQTPDIPADLAVPKGKVLMTVLAKGTQNYECARTPKSGLAWSFRAPEATLAQDGREIGRHFAGPTWEFSDGSRMTARVVAKAPGAKAGDVAWLKLATVERTKKGPAAGAKFVLRIATEGGELAGACQTEKEVRKQPYQATYVFVK